MQHPPNLTARRFRARFMPEKFQVIHFTKQKKVTKDLKGRELRARLERTVFSAWPSCGLRSGDALRRKPKVDSRGRGRGDSSRGPLRTKEGAGSCKVTKPYESSSKTSGSKSG